MSDKLKIELEYCVPCDYTARATWTAEELLRRFGEWTDEVKLVPGSGGAFELAVNGRPVYSKKRSGTFPDMEGLEAAVAKFLE